MTQNSVIVRCFLEKFTTSHVKRNKEKSKTGHTTKLKVMNKNDSKIIQGKHSGGIGKRGGG